KPSMLWIALGSLVYLFMLNYVQMIQSPGLNASRIKLMTTIKLFEIDKYLYFLYFSGDRWLSHNYKRYFISQSQASIFNAVNYCKITYNGTLLQINSASEIDILYDMVQTFNESSDSPLIELYWIDSVDLNSTLIHHDRINSNFTSENWTLRDQNSTSSSSILCTWLYLGYSSNQLQWMNFSCNDHFRFICQLGKERIE
ncbi:hypothetical protein TrispH2_010221, partial [Trichoplax sp. H2]